MSKANITVEDRKMGEGIHILDIHGEINAYAEDALMEAYTQASSNSASCIILNFSAAAIILRFVFTACLRRCRARPDRSASLCTGRPSGTRRSQRP